MINFFHYNAARNKNYGQSYTLALNLDFHKDTLFGALKRNLPVVIEGGIAKLHKDDRYIKKVGREVSSKMKDVLAFKITGINVEQKQLAFFMTCEEKNLIIILHVHDKKDRPILTYSSYNKVKYG